MFFATDIKLGRFTIVQLIEELRELLVNPSPSKRERGVEIFTEVLQIVSSDFLSVQQLKTISVFYTEKLSDHHQVSNNLSNIQIEQYVLRLNITRKL